MIDLQRAYETLSVKKRDYDRLFAYYDGEQPLTYTAKRLEEIFQNLNAYFAENWCSVVVDSTLERVNLERIDVGDAGLQARWDEMWQENNLFLDSDEVHEATLITGEGFVIAWEEEGKMQAFVNDPRLVHVFYLPSDPRKIEFAAKWWVETDFTARMTLYYPDRLEYYGTTQAYNSISNWQAFQAIEPGMAVNPFGMVPVFHFRLKKRKAKSDLTNVTPIQNAINKLLTDMMVTAEYAAFPQRYIISNADVNGKLKNAPNEVWDIPAGDGMGQQTQAGQFPAANLSNYLEGIDNLATAISSITRTPKHYFFSVGSNLSGEALIAMESPLNKKAQDRIDRFGPVWEELARFMLGVGNEGRPGRPDGSPIQSPVQISAVFTRPETIQPLTKSQTFLNYKSMGVPLKTMLRMDGWTEAELAQLEADQEEEQEKEQESLGQAVLRAERGLGSQQRELNTETQSTQSRARETGDGATLDNGEEDQAS